MRLSVRGDGIQQTVELDGQQIGHALKGMTVTYEAGSVPTAVLDVILHHGAPIGDDITHITIPPGTAELLIRLGWTPPTQTAPTETKRSNRR